MLTQFNDLKKKVDKGLYNKWLTRCGMVIMSVVFFFLLVGLVSYSGHSSLDYALMLLLSFATVYTWFIYLAKRPLKSLDFILKKSARQVVNMSISSRRKGLLQLMPHVAIIILALVLLTIGATFLSIIFRFDPFNFFYCMLLAN